MEPLEPLEPIKPIIFLKKNTFFRFKEFTVHQEHCAMKVCTDACILGAFTTAYMKSFNPQTVLDIGSGTGLLTLMLAQELDAKITAVELDADAAKQATENIHASPWANKINLLHTDYLEMDKSPSYDLIISNPPFYERDLKSPHPAKNAAMHDTTLTANDLIKGIYRQLNPSGKAFILIPYSRLIDFKKIISGHQLFAETELYIKQTPAHAIFRIILVLTKTNKEETLLQSLIIKDEEQQYTPEFINLLKSYYLNL